MGDLSISLGPETEKSLRQLYEQEELLEENSLFAEASFLPFPYHYANVATYSNLRRHVIDFEANSLKNAIPLEEILVGAFQERFYLTLKTKNQELIVTTGNVLNSDYAPLPLRFLRDVSRTKYSSLELFSLRDPEKFPFAPRIKYNRSILSPAQWRVDLAQIKAAPRDSLELIQEKFLDWAERWEIPRYVFMTYGDNRILLDYKKSEHLQEIISILKKNKAIKLVEKIGQEKGEWVKSVTGHHFSEFVVPFIKNKKMHSPKSLYIPKDNYQPSPNRWKLPGSDWLFVKFYLSQENEVNFLTHYLSSFTKNLQDQDIIEEWYFVRYHDSAPHIRVRFRSEKEKVLTALIPTLHDWSIILLQNKLIHDMHIGCYEREIERYGGENVIELAESFFCADALVAVELLSSIATGKLALPNFAIAALSLIDLLKGFGMNLEEMLLFLKTSSDDLSELKGFRQVKKDLMNMTSAVLGHPSIDSEKIFIIEAMNKRKEAQDRYIEKIRENHLQGSLSTSLMAIHHSLLHMHCNRLMGNQINLEKKALLFAHHTLKSLLNMERIGKDKSDLL